MNNYYFTFGSDPAYPYGMNDYVLVVAENINQACELFEAVHPHRPGSQAINCAFYYTEEQFREFQPRYYPNTPPIEIIAVTRREDA